MKPMSTLTWLPTNKNISTSEMVIAAIRSALEAGQLKPGDRLPPELELAGMMSISRGSVREALKILAAFGVLDIQRGNGTFIANSDAKVSMDPVLFSFLLAQPEEREIQEFRYRIEQIVIELAIRNASNEDLVALERNLDELRNSDSDPEETTRIDLEFHRLLGKCTNNRLIGKTYDFAMEYFSSSIAKTHRVQERMDNTIRVHELTLEVIRDRDYQSIGRVLEENNNLWIRLQRLND